MNLISSSF